MPIKFMSQAAETREQQEEEPRPLVVGILIIGGVGSEGGRDKHEEGIEEEQAFFQELV